MGAVGPWPLLRTPNLILGYLSDEQPLAGTIRLDRGLAEEAVDRNVESRSGSHV